MSQAGNPGGPSDPGRAARTAEGTIVEVLPHAVYAVDLDNGTRILSYVPGTLRPQFVRLVPGDRVTVEISPYNLARGRIVRSHH